ncbi:MAG: IS4/Tn5 family transposase DNA-binding protein, partial [Enterovibrio sp.]
MVFLTDAEQWATKTFSQADLGDLRRTKRLVKFTASLADH